MYRTLGLAAAIATCFIAAGWQVTTRHGVTTTLAPLDLALFRYAVPGLLLAPLWLRTGLLSGAPKHLVALMVLGAGLPFGLMVMMGATLAPVAHIAVLLPGTMPIFTALLANRFLGEPLSRKQITGFALILAGVASIGSASFNALTWKGDVILLTAALGWGIYSVAYRKSGLTPWSATAIINGWSLLAILPLWLALHQGQIFTANPSDLALQALWQGVLAGIIGLWLYGFATRRIGPTSTAAIGATVPALGAFGGWLLLGEPLTPQAVIGAALVTAGVALSTGIFSRRQPASP